MNPRAVCALVGLLAALACAASAKSTGKLVDSGSFGVYRGGQRVATETFTIEQQAGGSVANFQVKVGDSSPTQTSTLELSASGDLKRYEWHQLTPVKADAVVTPSDPFLTEHLSAGPGQKPMDQPFLVPPSTAILDNNFFAQREILAWRYLAAGCKQSGSQTECHLTPAKFGVLVPQALNTSTVTLEYAGWEKLAIHGVERELIRLTLHGDGADWSLWLDSSYKLMRITVDGENMEVVRD